MPVTGANCIRVATLRAWLGRLEANPPEPWPLTYSMQQAAAARHAEALARLRATINREAGASPVTTEGE